MNCCRECREKALREIRSIAKVNEDDFNIFKNCLDKSKKNIDTWLTDNQYQNNKIDSLKSDLKKFFEHLENLNPKKNDYLWNLTYLWAEKILQERLFKHENILKDKEKNKIYQ